MAKTQILEPGMSMLWKVPKGKINPKTIKYVPKSKPAEFIFNLIKLYESTEQIYSGIVKYSNGDIVIELTELYGTIRKFFGLKANGKYLFGDEKNYLLIHSLILNI